MANKRRKCLCLSGTEFGLTVLCNLIFTVVSRIEIGASKMTANETSSKEVIPPSGISDACWESILSCVYRSRQGRGIPLTLAEMSVIDRDDYRESLRSDRPQRSRQFFNLVYVVSQYLILRHKNQCQHFVPLFDHPLDRRRLHVRLIEILGSQLTRSLRSQIPRGLGLVGLDSLTVCFAWQQCC